VAKEDAEAITAEDVDVGEGLEGEPAKKRKGRSSRAGMSMESVVNSRSSLWRHW
jgi:hypothetical protein